MTDALDSLGACPIAPEAAVFACRPKTAGKTRFLRSVPSEMDVASRAAAEPGWRERTRPPNIEHADDRLASLRSCGFGRVTATAAATGIPGKRRSFYSLDADSAPRASPPRLPQAQTFPFRTTISLQRRATLRTLFSRTTSTFAPSSATVASASRPSRGSMLRST